MKRYLRATEYVWLTLSILCLAVAVYFFIIKDTESAGFALIITSFAVLMYTMRRRFNKHLQRMAGEKEEEKRKK